MTIRYATPASRPRSAYDQATGPCARQLTLTPVGRPIALDKVAWLASEMPQDPRSARLLLTPPRPLRLPYANICETRG